MAVTATSIVTLPRVRIRSGSISTATSSPSGATGTPIAIAIGPTETTKLIVPGRLTELSETRKATSTPAAKASGLSSTPVRCAA